MKNVTSTTVGIAGALLGLGLLCIAPVRAQSPRSEGFPDVPKDHWAAEAVRGLQAAQIVRGRPATSPVTAAPAYQGDRPVTRYEMALTLWRFVEYMDRAGKQKGAPKPPADGAEAVRRLIAGGYLPADTVLARDASTVTPEQFSVALAQVMAKTIERNTPPTPDDAKPPIEHPAHPHP